MRNYKQAREILDAFEQEITKLKQEIEKLKNDSALHQQSQFIRALEHLKNLAADETNTHSFFAYLKSKKSWPLHLIEELTAVLQESSLLKHSEKVAEILKICDKYQEINLISQPWAKAILILTCATLGLLIGASLGAVTGFLALSLIAGFAACALGEVVTFTLPLSLSLLLMMGIAIGSTTLGITAGCAGAATGGCLGFDFGEFLTQTTLDDLGDILFFSDEVQALHQQANEVKLGAQNSLASHLSNT